MTKFLKVRNVVALILIGIALYQPIVNSIPSKPKPDVAILNIDKPSDAIIELVTPISSLVTDPTDRAKVAIFSQEFANRIKKYDTDLQQLNDVVALAATEFFQGSIKDKYESFDDGVLSLITGVTGDDNHKLSEEEKTNISDRFMGLAWSLIQKR